MKRFVIIFFLMSVVSSVTAQTVYHHRLFWGRLVLADKISKKLSWELYLQKRTQSPHEKGNMLETPHFSGIWYWMSYTPNKNLKLTLSPFGHFSSHVFNRSESDMERPGIKEFRWTAKIETMQAFSFFNYSNKYSLEYRWRDMEGNDVYKPCWRARYMLRLEKPVKRLLSKEKPVTFFVADEVFIQFGQTVKDNPSLFNQNRINIGFNYEIIKNVKISLSYLNIYQQRETSRTFDVGHTAWFILTFDNLFSQFIKKKKNE